MLINLKTEIVKKQINDAYLFQTLKYIIKTPADTISSQQVKFYKEACRA